MFLISDLILAEFSSVDDYAQLKKLSNQPLKVIKMLIWPNSLANLDQYEPKLWTKNICKMKLRKSWDVSPATIKFMIRVCLVIFVSQHFNSNADATRLCQNVLPTIESVVGEVTGAFNVSLSFNIVASN